MSAGIFLRKLELDFVIGQTIQISSINLIQRLPALLRTLDMLSCLYGPKTFNNQKTDIIASDQ